MSSPQSSAESDEPSSGIDPPSIYGRVFWMSYIANALAVTANSLTFRFAEFVAYRGGTETLSGDIVATGLIVALVARFGLGQAMDRYGTRHLWLSSTVVFTVGCVWFLLGHAAWWELFAARILFAVGLAGMFSCSIVHVQKQVRPERRTEVIASLGSSGFLGMIVGPIIGDFIFRTIPAGDLRFQALFAGATGLACVYFFLVITLTRDEAHEAPHETPALHRLVFRYWPGPIVLVAIMMGINFTVISVFLTRFATHLKLEGIGTFFTGYAAAAFTFRLATRSWSDTIGRHWMALLGLLGVGCGQFLFLLVSQDWHLILPALACGFGHALLFPAVVSLGAGAFPPEYRGTGTTFVLGFTELGTVLSAPALGAIIDHFHRAGFPQMFATTGLASLGIAVYYALTAARKPDRDFGWETTTPVRLTVLEPASAAPPVLAGTAAATGSLHCVGKSA